MRLPWTALTVRWRRAGQHRALSVRTVTFLATLALLSLAASGLGSLQDVATLFRQARFAEAAAQLPESGQSGRPAERLLWQVRLADRPDRLLELCETALTENDLPAATRQQIVLQAASVEFARGNHREALELLLPAIDDDGDLPGTFYLLAGFNYRALGSIQRAREMLASVRVDDAAFCQARCELGRIGLAADETTLALRYFESAARHADAARHPALLLGRWEALRRSELPADADAVERELLREHPQSLSALVMRDRLRTEQELSETESAAAAAADTAGAVEETAADEVILTKPHSIQLAAFRDRALALEFAERWRRQLPDLRIDQEADRRGEPLYKIRTGRYASRTRADTEAARIGNEFGLETLVVQLHQ